MGSFLPCHRGKHSEKLENFVFSCYSYFYRIRNCHDSWHAFKFLPSVLVRFLLYSLVWPYPGHSKWLLMPQVFVNNVAWYMVEESERVMAFAVSIRTDDVVGTIFFFQMVHELLQNVSSGISSFIVV